MGEFAAVVLNMFNTNPQAVERARALLAAHCTAEQRANWEQQGWLYPIFGSEGGSFAFGTWAHAGATNPMLITGVTDPTKLFYQLWEYDPGTRDARYRWCVLPQGGYSQGGLPEYDCILGTKLLVEADEPAFRAIANRQWSRDAQPAPGEIAIAPGHLQQAVEAIIQQRLNAAAAEAARAQQEQALLQNAANQLYAIPQQLYPQYVQQVQYVDPQPVWDRYQFVQQCR